MNETKDVEVSIESVDKQQICTRNKGVFYENFKEDEERMMNMDLNQFGSVFCEPLNGHLIRLDEALENSTQFIRDVRTFHRAKKSNQNSSNWAIDSYFYSPAPDKPRFGYFATFKDVEFLNIQTDEKYDLNSDARLLLDTVQSMSYQAQTKFCTGAGVKYLESDIAVWPVNCNHQIQHLNILCAFEQKVQVRLSGTCAEFPVDLNYALVGARPQENEGGHWHDWYRYGTFSGNFSAPSKRK